MSSFRVLLAAMSNSQRSAPFWYTMRPASSAGAYTSHPLCLVCCRRSPPPSACDQRFMVPSRSVTKYTRPPDHMGECDSPRQPLVTGVASAPPLA